MFFILVHKNKTQHVNNVYFMQVWVKNMSKIYSLPTGSLSVTLVSTSSTSPLPSISPSIHPHPHVPPPTSCVRRCPVCLHRICPAAQPSAAPLSFCQPGPEASAPASFGSPPRLPWTLPYPNTRCMHRRWNHDGHRCGFFFLQLLQVRGLRAPVRVSRRAHRPHRGQSHRWVGPQGGGRS